MKIHTKEGNLFSAGFLIIILALTLMAFWLRVVGISSLSMWGDSSYSVFSANRNLINILTERVSDGHPPFYYYLLHFWILVSGNSELSVRLLSVFTGVLTVPLSAVLGQRIGGRTLGIAAALLITISPELVYYSRLIRMYSLATFLALLSLYLFWLALRRGNRRYWAAYFVVTLVALFTHYYTIFLVVAEAIFFVKLFWQRRAGNSLSNWLGIQIAFAVLYLPWLAYAGPTQASKTAWIISHAPAARGLFGFLEQVWVPFNVGVTVDSSVATPLSLAFLLLVAVGVLLWVKKGGQQSPLLLLLSIAVTVPVVLSYLIFLVAPYAVRPRFLLIYLPAYLILLAWVILKWQTVHRAALSVALVFVVGSQAFSLADTYYVERNMLETETIMVAQQLERYAEQGDAVIFHAGWQIGYLRSHYPDLPVTPYFLEDVNTTLLPAQLMSHKRIWLAMFDVRRGDPNFPLEGRLDKGLVRLDEWYLGKSRLMLYALPPEGEWRPMTVEFQDHTGQPALQLKAARLSSTQLTAGGALAVGLRWQIVEDFSQRFTVFVQLLDDQGRLIAGHDSEPQGGVRLTDTWRKGDEIEDLIGLSIPKDAPPGNHSVVLGLYQTGSPGGLPRMVGGGLGPDRIALLGSVQVKARAVDSVKPPRPIKATFNDKLELFGYETDLDFFQVGEEKDIHPMLEETITLTFPRQSYRPGDTVNLKLYWRTLAKITEDYQWHLDLVDKLGQVVAQAEGPLARLDLPTNTWGEGQVAITKQSFPLNNNLTAGRYELRLSLIGQSSLDNAVLRASEARSASLALGNINIK